jgi:hypothetical protein
LKGVDVLFVQGVIEPPIEQLLVELGISFLSDMSSIDVRKLASALDVIPAYDVIDLTTTKAVGFLFIVNLHIGAKYS